MPTSAKDTGQGFISGQVERGFSRGAENDEIEELKTIYPQQDTHYPSTLDEKPQSLPAPDEIEDLPTVYPESANQHRSTLDTGQSLGDLPTHYWSENDNDLVKMPKSIKGFTFIRALGEGGMGSVYLAKRDATQDQVALKLIGTSRISDEMRGRFREETRVLALMHHPHIARLYEAGITPDGQPYLAMEYLDGVDLIEFVSQNELSLEEKLNLFLQVCDGVEHAHQKAVLHRDLKPSNIIVTMENGKPVARLIDFGLARALDDDYKPYETRVGAIMGTPAYMSPEQLRGNPADLDTRADIYALGVILYEILTGDHPLNHDRLKKSNLEETLTLCRTVEPPLPSERLRKSPGAGSRSPQVRQLARKLKGDLDWIVYKAMEKEVDRRYAAVGDFKSDVQAYLGHFPIKAARPDMFYRIRKYIRRNRLFVTVASTMAITVFAALLIVSLSLAQARRERDRAGEALSFLEDALTSADARNLGINATVADVLARAENDIDKFPDIEGRVRFLMGRTYFSHQSYENAVEQFQLAFDEMRRTLGESHPQTLRVRYFVGRTYIGLQKMEEAETHLAATLRAQERTLGFLHDDTLDTAISLGYLLKVRWRLEEAEHFYTDLIARAGEGDRNKLLSMKTGLAGVYSYMGRYHDAENLNRNIIAIEQELPSELQDKMRTNQNNLARSLMKQGAFKEALAHYKEVYEVREARSQTGQHAMGTRLNLAICMAEEGLYQESWPHMEALLAHYQRRGGQNMFRAYRLKADLLLGQGEALAAVNSLEHALSAIGHGNSLWHAVLFARLATAYLEAGRMEDAWATAGLVIANEAAYAGDTDNPVPEAYSARARILDAFGRKEEALHLQCLAWEHAGMNPQTLDADNYVAEYANRLAQNGLVAQGRQLLQERYDRARQAEGTRRERLDAMMRDFNLLITSSGK